MNSRDYDNHILIQYLLGTLPEAQAEECDELSIIDDSFAARLEDVENDLVDAYVRGEISGQNLKAFESYYLSSPRRREKVAFAKSFQTFTEQQVVTQPVQAAASIKSAIDEPQTERQTKSDSWWNSLLSLFTIPNLTLQWGMATAALLMFLAGGWFVWETMRLRGQVNSAQTEYAALQQREKELQAQIEQQRTANTKNLEQLNQELARTQQQLTQLQQEQELARQQAKAQPPTDATEPSLLHVELSPQTRGIGKSQTLTIPAGTGYAVLQLETEDDDYQNHQAELRSLSNDQLLWKSGKLKARTRGNAKIIDLNLRARLLAPGDYVISLKGVSASGQLEDIHRYSFKVVK